MATVRTVRQLIDGALRLVGIYEVGETTRAEDTTRALQVLQDLLAEEAGSLFVPIIVYQGITLVASQATYTVGENGSPDLNTQRPEQIVGAFVRDSGDVDHPVAIIGEQQYKKIPDKTASGRPEYIWYNPTVPNGIIYCYYVPDAAETLYIDSRKTLPEPTTLTENLLNTTGIARNYHNPLKWMLAMELCGEYGREPSKLIVSKNNSSKTKIIELNMARSVQPVNLEIGVKGFPATGEQHYGNFFNE